MRLDLNRTIGSGNNRRPPLAKLSGAVGPSDKADFGLKFAHDRLNLRHFDAVCRAGKLKVYFLRFSFNEQ
jgi:hypothetical protein